MSTSSSTPLRAAGSLRLRCHAFPRVSAATAWAPVRSRSANCTAKPNAARRRAIAAPIPLAPPVINAERPCSPDTSSITDILSDRSNPPRWGKEQLMAPTRRSDARQRPQRWPEWRSASVNESQALIADRYRLLRRIGSGGMGVVWEGMDERLERRVALKQLYRQSEGSTREAELANQRALREARLTARLQHPHAVPVFDAVEQDGQLWLIMQFVPSITLAAVLQESGPLQPDEAAKVGAEVASALAAAHAVGIVHRDVKPGNILIADDGTAMISDFGISSAMGDVTLTSTGEVHGTPAYLAPEVARGGQASTASDVFSLGSTLYAAVEGTPPFGTDQNSIALLHRVAAADYPPPQQAGPLAPLLAEMLSSDPADRPPMGAVAGRLKALSGDSAMAPSPAPGPVAAGTGSAAAAAAPAVAGTAAGEPTAPAPPESDL